MREVRGSVCEESPDGRHVLGPVEELRRTDIGEYMGSGPGVKNTLIVFASLCLNCGKHTGHYTNVQSEWIDGASTESD